MKSIRLYLLLALIATITLVNFVSLLRGYQSSMEEAQNLFDSRLQSMAKLIAAANSEHVQSKLSSQQKTPFVFFQIWDDTGNLITRSQNAPIRPLSGMIQGFHDINYQNYRWRNYVYQDIALKRWIVVSERSDIRYELAEGVVQESIFPIVFSIPIAALIIWWAIGIGLRPLRDVTRQLTQKQADDLSPLELENTPTELTRLVQTTNDLFRRLDEAFLREQRFSADAAHELRTPISVLKVHLHNLQQTMGDEESQELALLAQGIERMGHLIEQILALYSNSPDQAAVKFADIDLYKIAQNQIARLYPQFERKQQSIELYGDSALMEGDEFALETLLQNLLTNANKYTPEHGSIIVEVAASEQGFTLTVEDSGPGIPKEQYQRVFERFYRLHGDQHHSGIVGCGLGLAIVKHVVDLHHAQIQLGASRFASGLMVTVVFPVKREN